MQEPFQPKIIETGPYYLKSEKNSRTWVNKIRLKLQRIGLQVLYRE